MSGVLRVAGIDPGLRTGALVILDVAEGARAHVIRAVNIGMPKRKEERGVNASDLALICSLVRDELAATAPSWLAVEDNVMRGCAGARFALQGRGAILAGVGYGLGHGAWLGVQATVVRRSLLGKPNATEEAISRFVADRITNATGHLKSAHLEDAALLALWVAQEAFAALDGSPSALEKVGA